MAKKGSTKNYGFGQKNNWRRTVWNEVLRRTDGREKHEPILYLAGPEDIDRVIAREKGVPDQNLIAIDRSPANAQRVRDKKSPALYGDLQEILASWPKKRKVCAVLMDFCCGLTMDAVDVYDLFERAPLRDAVVMVNLMRGRDQWSNTMRANLSGLSEDQFGMLAAVSCWGYGEMGPPGSDCLDEKHRAAIWLCFHAVDAWRNTAKATVMPLVSEWTEGLCDQYEDVVGLMWSGNYFKLADPHFYSYRSGALTFDSVVLSYPVGAMLSAVDLAMRKEGEPTNMQQFFMGTLAGWRQKDTSEAHFKPYDVAVERNHSHRKSMDMARKVAAMLAIRTSRQRVS